MALILKEHTGHGGGLAGEGGPLDYALLGQIAWNPVPALPLTNDVNSGHFLMLSRPQSLPQ